MSEPAVPSSECGFRFRRLAPMFNFFRRYSGSVSPLTILLCWPLAIALGMVSAGCRKNPAEQAQRHDKRAKELVANGKSDEAIIEYRREIQSVPTLAAPHAELAKIYLDKKEYLSAYREYLTVLKLDPKNREAKELVAEMLLADQKFDDSNRLAKELAAENPNDTRALLIEAACAFGKKDTKESRSLTEQVLKIEPNNSHALVQMALLQVQSNRMGPAEDNLKKAIAADPKWNVPVATLAALYMQEKAPQKARIHFTADIWLDTIFRQASRKNQWPSTNAYWQAIRTIFSTAEARLRCTRRWGARMTRNK